MQKTINIFFDELTSKGEVSAEDQDLINHAISIAKKAYSPYSNFPVGASIRLSSGEIYSGNNQENIAYPSGTCAERTVLNYVHANFPDKIIETIAITALNATADKPVSPCGFCRQVLVEMEQNQKHKMRVILYKLDGAVYIFSSAKDLLPLAFEDAILGNK